MKKSLIAGASVFALLGGVSSSAWADDINVAVGLNVLGQTVTNSAEVLADNDDEGMGIAGGAVNSLNNNFGNNTYEEQVLNQNNINSGINSIQQGGNAAALAVDGDGVSFDIDPPNFDANLSIAGNIAEQDATNYARVNAGDNLSTGDPDDAEFNGIAGGAEESLNNNFGSDTFDKQVLNQNNINSGINSAQQGANASAISADLDGSEDELSINAAFSGNYLTQDVDNDAINSDAGNEANDDNDAIAGEVDDSMNNNFGRQTFENQVMNQNNINSGINSAQQGANTTSIAASVGPNPVDFDPGQPDVTETETAVADAIDAVQAAADFDVPAAGIGNVGSNVELFEGNVAAARSQGRQTVDNNAFNSGEGDYNPGEEDGGIGGDPERSLYNNFGDETFRAQILNQNNINSGINSAQQGANTSALAVDTDGSFNILDVNVAVALSDQEQTVVNSAFAGDEHNDGVGGFDADDGPDGHALHNDFGERTFQDQVLNQNNINAGINSAQQGMNTSAIAYDNSGSLADLNVAWAETKATQLGSNTATDESTIAVADDTGLGVGGNPRNGNLNNDFGNDTFMNQVLNQNNINAGINSAQQGGNTSALAIADNLSLLDINLAYAESDLTQGTAGAGDWDNVATVDNNTGSGGIGGNPGGANVGTDPLSNEFGSQTFRNQVLNQNNINAGINSAQQGANTTALAIDLGGPGGVDLNGAVSLASLSQTVSNTANALGASNGGIGGGAVNALNNNFGANTFTNQVMNQNNINSGINSVQQGANTVALAVSGASPLP